MHMKAQEIWDKVQASGERVHLFMEYHIALRKKLRALSKKSLDAFQIMNTLLSSVLQLFATGTHRNFITAVCFFERLLDQTLSTLKPKR